MTNVNAIQEDSSEFEDSFDTISLNENVWVPDELQRETSTSQGCNESNVSLPLEDVSELEGPYDFIFHGIPKRHHVLKPQGIYPVEKNEFIIVLMKQKTINMDFIRWIF